MTLHKINKIFIQQSNNSSKLVTKEIQEMFMKKEAIGKFKVQDYRGLHAGPSTEIVKCASTFKSEIYLTYQKQSVSAKSLLSILMLTASKGAQIGVKAEGEDAEEAVQSILNVANQHSLLKLSK